ncbi:MAG: hypothetical protein JXR70_11245 [Spirochaetales bacterium]|nr:hypothetical protein [Spirochaetales bacterium]
MSKKRLLIPAMVLIFITTMFILSAQDRIIKSDYTFSPTGVPEKERLYFSSLIAENPNYFGTMEKSIYQSVIKINNNTKYEQLTHVGLYPEKDLLEAFVEVKLPYGYNDQLCGDGSYEYVRFFADWNNNSIYDGEDEDLGLSQVNVHDIPNNTNQCLPVSKPLSYAVYLKIDPEKWYCEKPRLVKIKAILSWQYQPTPGNPDYKPVWGNTVEKWVQIQPKARYILLEKDPLALDPYAVDIPELAYTPPPAEPKEYVYTPEELKKLYIKQPVSELRYDFNNLAKKFINNPDELLNLTKAYPDYYKIELPQIQYEQLNTVGLNYELDELSAQVTIKRPYGYSGELCSSGSSEYIAFWLYIWDPVLQICRWQYAGSASFKAHDIPSIPAQGLNYAVRIPANLYSFKKSCANPVVLKLRGVLSWGSAPPNNNPNYLPVWGNRVEKNIQLRPVFEQSSGHDPFISVVGGMAVASISGNDQTTVPSSLGPGYANGPSVLGGGEPAIESPFGSTVTIGGHIANPPDISSGATPYKYQMQYRKSTSGTNPWHTVENRFRIWISQHDGYNWTMSTKMQAPVNGWYNYEEDFSGSVIRFVEGNVFAQWASAQAVEGDGLYEVRIVLDDNTAGPLIYSNVIRVMIDNTRPDAELILNAGDCSKFYIGDMITGNITVLDDHIWKYTLTITPTNNPPWVSPSYEIFPAMAAPGYSGKAFTINTNTTPSCGYVINLKVWDRTIRNNYLLGNYSTNHAGFCLLD